MSYPSLSETITDFITYEKKRNQNKRPYIEKHRVTLQKFCDLINNPSIDKVTPAIVRLFFNDKADSNSMGNEDYTYYYPENYFLRAGPERTIYELRAHFKFWGWACEKYKLVQPLIIPTNEEKRGALEPISDDEKEKILNRCTYSDYIEGLGLIKNPNMLLDRAVFILWVETGLSHLGLREVCTDDIRFDRKRIVSRSLYSGELTDLPLSDSALQIISEYIEARGKSLGRQSGRLFTDRYEERLTETYYLRLLERLFGYKGFYSQWKRVRKTFALSSIKRVRSLEEVKPPHINKYYLLGEIMDLYSLTEEEIRDALGLKPGQKIDIDKYYK